MSIGKYLDKIRNAVYGREVRESIAKGIETAYNDASEKHDNANMEVKLARGANPNLNTRLNKMDEVDKQTTAQLAQTQQQKADKTHIWSMESMGQDVKEAMTGGSVAVVGENAVLEENVVPGQITGTSTDFVRGVNLYKGKTTSLYAESGSLSTTSSVEGGYVKLKPGQRYSINIAGEHNRFIVSLADTLELGEPATRIHSVPNNLFRTNSHTFVNENSKYLIVTYSRVTDGENYKPNISIKEGNDLTLGNKKVTEIDYYGNLFNGEFQYGKAINTNLNQSDITEAENGVWAVFENIDSRPHFVKVEGTFNRFSVGFSNSLEIGAHVQLVVKEMDIAGLETVEVRNESNQKYLIVYVSSRGEEPNIYVGRGQSEVKEPRLEIEGYSIPLKTGTDDKENTNNIKYATTYEENNATQGAPSTHDELYLELDKLIDMDNNYVEKEILGSNGQDNQLLSYKLSKDNTRNTTSYTKPKIGILASIHGDEKGPAVATLNFLKVLVENPHNNESLNKIKSNVDFYIIPTGNPTGWDNNTRKNGNDVDLNRNFTEGWVEIVGGNNNSGSGPASEIETQLIEQWMEDNQFDYFIDFHNTAYGSMDYPNEEHTLSWFVGDNENKSLLERQYVKVMNLVSTLWAEKNSRFPRDTAFGYARGMTGATAMQQASTTGAKSVIFEASWRIGYVNDVKYGQTTNQFATELLGNYLFEICKEFI